MGRQVFADARSAARTRADFASWLDSHYSLGTELFNDLLLAVNEQIANAAEFAYADSLQRGKVDVDASCGAHSGTLAVTVSDHGRWRDRAPRSRPVCSCSCGVDRSDPSPLHHLRGSTRSATLSDGALRRWSAPRPVATGPSRRSRPNGRL